jgi:hypothetical protein
MKQSIYAVGTALVLCSIVLAKDVPKAADDRPTSDVAIQSIPFHELVQTFATNEARAEALYQDKQVTVSGAVVRVVASRHPPRAEGKDAYFVELKAEDTDPSTIYVQFFFDKAERGRLAKLRAGQQVIIQGLCGRPAVWSGDRRKNQKDYLEVPVRNCKVLKVK